MKSPHRHAWIILPGIALFAALNAANSQTVKAVSAPNAVLSATNIAGLYQMIDPRGYADPLAAAVYLRLLPDGRSRLEGIVVSDLNGSISSRTEIGSFHRTAWAVRQTPSGPELCLMSPANRSALR